MSPTYFLRLNHIGRHTLQRKMFLKPLNYSLKTTFVNLLIIKHIFVASEQLSTKTTAKKHLEYVQIVVVRLF